MIHKKVTISAPYGIHTRPATLLVKRARDFNCDIQLEYKGRRANAKNVLRLLTLAMTHGCEVTVRASGEQAQQAVEAVSSLISEMD